MLEFWETIRHGNDRLWQNYTSYRTIKPIGKMTSLTTHLNHIFTFPGSFKLYMQQLAKRIPFLHMYLYAWKEFIIKCLWFNCGKLELKNNLTHLQYVSYNTWKCRKTAFWSEFSAGSEILIVPTRFQSASPYSMKHEHTHGVWGLS